MARKKKTDEMEEIIDADISIDDSAAEKGGEEETKVNELFEEKLYRKDEKMSETRLAQLLYAYRIKRAYFKKWQEL